VAGRRHGRASPRRGPRDHPGQRRDLPPLDGAMGVGAAHEHGPHRAHGHLHPRPRRARRRRPRGQVRQPLEWPPGERPPDSRAVRSRHAQVEARGEPPRGALRPHCHAPLGREGARRRRHARREPESLPDERRALRSGDRSVDDPARDGRGAHRSRPGAPRERSGAPGRGDHVRQERRVRRQRHDRQRQSMPKQRHDLDLQRRSLRASAGRRVGGRRRLSAGGVPLHDPRALGLSVRAPRRRYAARREPRAREQGDGDTTPLDRRCALRSGP
jgi:hypothetical protein